MFTGLIQELGTVLKADRHGGFRRLWVSYDPGRGPLRAGDSMAVNGVCLTATALEPRSFSADLSGETQRSTTLGELRIGATVNLERPVTASDPLGGHIVLGHVDGVGTVQRVRRGNAGLELFIQAPPAVMACLVPKGSIAVDGVSLTTGVVERGGFSVYLIPETAARTTLGAKRGSEPVNLETDYLAKLVQKFLGRQQSGVAGAASAARFDE